MIGSLIEKLQISEFDLLIFCADTLYIFFFTVFAAKFSHYFVNFRFSEVLHCTQKEGASVLLGCFIVSINMVMLNIVAKGMHESLLNGIFSIAIYTILAIFVLLFRKHVAILNIAPRVIQYKIEEKESGYIYEASSIVSGAIILGAALHYFYELSLFKIFLICIMAEIFIESMVRLYSVSLNYFFSYTLSKALNADDDVFLAQIATLRIHMSLLIVAAASIVVIDDEAIFNILASIFSLVLVLLAVCAVLFVIIERIILQSQYVLNKITPNKNYGSVLMQFMIYVSTDITIICLLG